MPAFSKILIANRGEIACRIQRSARALGYRTVAVFSSADEQALHVREADEALLIGPPPVQASYLNIAALLDAARRSGADAVHPGYGLLSESPAFAQACLDAGLVFIGPGVDAIALMGNKRAAKQQMLAAGVPCVPGYQGPDLSDAALTDAAERLGYPLMIKASQGGGGRGMRLVHQRAQLAEALRGARSEALNAFGSDEVILEKALVAPRHVEIQVLADQHGHCLHLGERDCSIQRRHQKIIEEAPCPALTEPQRQAMGAAALRACAAVDYVGAGTVEFLLDREGAFYFLEMNTRLQVEHPVTEAVTGLDLVAWQLRIAQGEPLTLRQHEVPRNGHAIEARLYAEAPAQGFVPQTGNLLRWRPPNGVRIDHGLREGKAITPWYDPLLAKLVAHGRDREEARRRLLCALQDLQLFGVHSNQGLLAHLLADADLRDNAIDTGFLERHRQYLQAPVPTACELAVAALRLHQRDSASQRAELAGFSNQLSGRWRYRLDDQWVGLRSLPGQAWQARALEQTLQLKALEDDWVEIDGHRRRFPWYLDGDQLWLGHQGRTLLLIDHTLALPARTETRHGQVTAPMAGAIVDVRVTNGTAVKRGDTLLVLEAMKMQQPLKAAADGQVQGLTVNVGDQVRSRQLLLSILATVGDIGTQRT